MKLHIVANSAAELEALQAHSVAKSAETVTGQTGMKDLIKLDKDVIILSSMSIPTNLLAGRKFYNVRLNLNYQDAQTAKEEREYLISEGTASEWADAHGQVTRYEIKQIGIDLQARRIAKLKEEFPSMDDERKSEVLAQLLGLAED